MKVFLNPMIVILGVFFFSVAIKDDHRLNTHMSDTHFAGTNGVNEVDPLLDTLVSDTISGVPTPRRSQEVIDHLEKAGIIPKVVDRFTPTTTVRVVYNDNLVRVHLKHGFVEESEICEKEHDLTMASSDHECLVLLTGSDMIQFFCAGSTKWDASDGK
jgi:hypothetical protein